MSKLKLEHIAPYLHYGLNAYIDEIKFTTDGFDPEFDCLDIIESGIIILTGLNYKNSYLPNCVMFRKTKIDGSDGYAQIENIKPILRPLSEFEYDHIVQIKEYLGLGEWCDHYDQYFDVWFDDAQNVQKLALQCPYKILQYFFKNHFDTFGLIKQDLAVDINTLKL